MKITEMKKEDFATVPELDLWNDWEKLAPTGYLEFRSFVIIPVERNGKVELYDETDWGCMEFCLVNDNMEPIGKVGGGSDVVNLDGIGGYGSHKSRDWGVFTKLVPAKGWSIDCLPCGYLNVWAKRVLFLEDRFVGSNFEPYSEEDRRPRKE